MNSCVHLLYDVCSKGISESLETVSYVLDAPKNTAVY